MQQDLEKLTKWDQSQHFELATKFDTHMAHYTYSKLTHISFAWSTEHHAFMISNMAYIPRT